MSIRILKMHMTFLCALRDQGYYFCLTIDIDKASKTIIYDQDNEMISKDSFIQKFS